MRYFRQRGWRTWVSWSPLKHLADLGLGVSIFWMKNLSWGGKKQNTSGNWWAQNFPDAWFFFYFYFFKKNYLPSKWVFFSSCSGASSVSLNFTPKVLHFCLFSLSYKITGFEHVFVIKGSGIGKSLQVGYFKSLAGLALVQLACCLLMLDLHPSNVLSRAWSVFYSCWRWFQTCDASVYSMWKATGHRSHRQCSSGLCSCSLPSGKLGVLQRGRLPLV